MAPGVTPPRGMRDFLPAEKARREHALGVIRRVYSNFGFDEIETPVVEDYARLHSGLGGDNEKLAFNVQKRGLTPDDLGKAVNTGDLSSLTDLGLRFDLTVPLARFYATHRGDLPPVFRSIQIAPVWRAERPQKGRYRQFVQCDIDIIGEAGPLAEIELLTATAGALRELGLTGCRVRINDRRLLTGMLDVFGFEPDEHSQVLITIDKLDKVGVGGVLEELRTRGATSAAVDALELFLTRVVPENPGPFGEAQIRAQLPDGIDDAVIAELASIGVAAEQADAAATGREAGDAPFVVFDPFLVRGMGYYTGPIFEIEHPELGYSLGGGGRYDGMIGRFLGSDVPATGFSIGFERIVDLISLPEASAADSLVLVYDKSVPPVRLVSLKAELVAEGRRVRLEPRVKNLKALLARVETDGFRSFAFVTEQTASASDLEIKPLG
ncbi:histidine--tRNA ligase [Mycetocola zhujimingii]|uniref:Histidine--tRNA ligase n=1 Tax=Mycetocola zhujimingii TaxID=2079792 RepID=A0A2U1TI44_9MICO|nr:histidine--tRNA ligase [Mycetocola zhujimingii]PWC08526.1 histidine--tRNA ligase [Mycetocola zhujimingii]